MDGASSLKAEETCCTGQFHVNLTQAKVILDKETSIEKKDPIRPGCKKRKRASQVLSLLVIGVGAHRPL